MDSNHDPAHRYHHGQLRDALVEAGMQLARSGGPVGVGLRAASREAGVSHNAAYRHFADLDALLAAVSEQCMIKLGTLMQERINAVRRRDPTQRAWERLNAIGTAYVEFATNEPGWFRTAFTLHDQPPIATELAAAADQSGPHPYALLSARLDELVAVGAIPAERRPGLEIAAWSALHGLSTLLVDGPLRGLGPTERSASLQVVLQVVARGL